MGQMTYGIMFGIIDNSETSEELCDKWADENNAFAMSYEARMKIVPDHVCVDDAYLGFWVAVGGSGMDGVPYLDDVCLDELNATYSKQIILAKERWRKYAEWAEVNGEQLPKAQLWLVKTEVA